MSNDALHLDYRQWEQLQEDLADMVAGDPKPTSDAAQTPDLWDLPIHEAKWDGELYPEVFEGEKMVKLSDVKAALEAAREADATRHARELEAAKADTQRVAKELMDALNEPMYSGSRDDWKFRAQATEAKVEDLRARLQTLEAENRELRTALANAEWDLDV